MKNKFRVKPRHLSFHPNWLGGSDCTPRTPRCLTFLYCNAAVPDAQTAGLCLSGKSSGIWENTHQLLGESDILRLNLSLTTSHTFFQGPHIALSFKAPTSALPSDRPGGH